MFEELYDKNNLFRKKYLNNLVNRFSNASLQVEGVNGDLSDTLQAMNIYQQTQAIEYAFDFPKDEKLNVGTIKEIENMVTGGEIDNFRTTKAEVIGSNVPRSKAGMIYMDIYTLLDNYYNVWKDLDPFLREAYFHIRFLHIHPFEDGNGRVARILLIRNLCANGGIPCVITKQVKDEYCQYIENNDTVGLAEFLRKLSNNEMNTMINIYKSLDEKKLIYDNNMNDKQEYEYNLLIGKKQELKKEYPLLRDITSLIRLFKAASIKLEQFENLNITKISKLEQIIDKNNDDQAIYYEDQRIMVIKLSDSEKVFKIIQVGNELIYKIDDQSVFADEFDYELKNVKNVNKIKTLLK